MPLGYTPVSNPPAYYDHVAFSQRRRDKNQCKVFDVNAFVSQVTQHMEEKYSEYKKARFKSFTRFEEKCDFIDDVVFSAMRACSEKQTDENVKALVDAFEQGVKKFTTFGNMSGLAKIFESAYFSLTTMTPTMVRDDYGKMVQKEVATVNASQAQFQMSKATQNVVCEETMVTKAVEFKMGVDGDSKNVVTGVPVTQRDASHMQPARKTATYGRFFDQVSSFSAMMAQVRVPQGPVVGQVVNETDDCCHGKERCSA